MNRIFRILWVLPLLLLPLACKKNRDLVSPLPPEAPTATATESPTATPTGTWDLPTHTPTRTPSPTITWTPWPAADCALFVADLTANIDGAPVTGDTRGKANRFVDGNLTASPDDLYRFTLSAPATLSISLCGSATVWDSYLQLRPGDCNQAPMAVDDDGCGSNLSAMELALAAGTYWLIVDGWGSIAPEAGPYVLSISNYRSPTPTPTATATETASPTDTATVTETFTPTETPTGTWEPPTSTFTPSRTRTPTVTRTPTWSPSPTFTATRTGTPDTPTFTRTFTPTWSPTPTPPVPWTPTPTFTVPASCAANLAQDITENLLSGMPVTGTTVGRPSHYAWEPGMSGSLSGDVLYVFHLAASRTVTLSLCPTLGSHPDWDSILYLRTACDSSATNLQYDDDSCGHLSRIVRTLGPGTYYLIVDGYGNYEACEGPFILGFGADEGPPVCTVTPQGAPLPESEPNDSAGQANDLGEIPSGDAVRTGSVEAAQDPEDHYRFRAPCGAFVQYEVTLDCYGDGLSSNRALLIHDGQGTLIAEERGVGPLLASVVEPAPGQELFVTLTVGTGPYRLRVAAVASSPVASSGVLPALEAADESEPNDSPADADDLGALTAGSPLAARGRLDEAAGDGTDFYSFVPTGVGMSVSVMLDQYDDGSSANDFGVVVRDGGGGVVATGSGSDPVESAWFVPVPGNPYTVEISVQGGTLRSGCYRLLLKGQ